MKTHSEISIGWVILYACVLASISGEDSTEKNLRETINENIAPKVSATAANYKLIKCSGDSGNVAGKAKTIDHTK